MQHYCNSVVENTNCIAVKINSRSTRALIDTGSSVTAVSEEFFNKLKVPPHLLQRPNINNLVSANKTPLLNLGTVELHVNLQGISCAFRFCVLQNLNHDVLFGTNWLSLVKAKIDIAGRNMKIFDDLVSVPLISNHDRASLLCLAKPIRIPPKCEVILTVKSHPKYNNTISMVEAYKPVQQRLMSAARVLVMPRQSRTVCRLINIGNRPKRLKAGTAVAVIQPVDLSDPFNADVISGIDQTSKVAVSSISQTHIPSHNERIKILQQRGLDLTLTKQNLTDAQYEQMSALLFNYAELFITDLDHLPCSKLPPVQVELSSDRPVYQRQFRQSPHLEAALQKECDKLLKAGVIKPSLSPYNAPAFVIRKATPAAAIQRTDQLEGKFRNEKIPAVATQYRMITDYRALNKLIKPQFHPLQPLEDSLRQLAYEGPKYLTKMDIYSAFYQQTLDQSASPYTAFSSSTQHYEYNRVPLGLKISPTSFQAELSKLLISELGQSLQLYVDDLLLANRDFTTHITVFESIFRKFKENNLRFSAKKCNFAQQEIEHFL